MTTKEDIKRVYKTLEELEAAEDTAYANYNKKESKPFYWVAPF